MFSHSDQRSHEEGGVLVFFVPKLTRNRESGSEEFGAMEGEGVTFWEGTGMTGVFGMTKLTVKKLTLEKTRCVSW